eukprot:jgi/Mesvir1/23495/Mv22337-RA.1
MLHLWQSPTVRADLFFPCTETSQAQFWRMKLLARVAQCTSPLRWPAFVSMPLLSAQWEVMKPIMDFRCRPSPLVLACARNVCDADYGARREQHRRPRPLHSLFNSLGPFSTVARTTIVRGKQCAHGRIQTDSWCRVQRDGKAADAGRAVSTSAAFAAGSMLGWTPLRMGAPGVRHTHATTATRHHATTTAGAQLNGITGGTLFLSPSEEATEALATVLASQARAGDVLCLYGDVGMGKSVFCRQFIRAITGDDETVVPSPTFLLQIIYDEHEGPPVHHFDLYRLEGGGKTYDLGRLDLDHSFASAVSLIEWADRLTGSNRQSLTGATSLPEDRLDVYISMAVATSRGISSFDDAGDLRSRTLSPPGSEDAHEESGRPDSADSAEPAAGFDGPLEEAPAGADSPAEIMVTEDMLPRGFVLVPRGTRWQRVVARLAQAVEAAQSCAGNDASSS